MLTHLSQHATVSVWLYEQLSFRIEGKIRGFDEFLNLVLDDAVVVGQVTKTQPEETRKPLGMHLRLALLFSPPVYMSNVICRPHPTQGRQHLTAAERVAIRRRRYLRTTSGGSALHSIEARQNSATVPSSSLSTRPSFGDQRVRLGSFLVATQQAHKQTAYHDPRPER